MDPATAAASAWDILTEPEPIVWEAKLVATKQDVIDWMERVQRAAESDDQRGIRRFGLVYSQVKTPLVAALTRLRDVALECGSDRDKFDALAGETEYQDLVRRSRERWDGFANTLREGPFAGATSVYYCA